MVLLRVVVLALLRHAQSIPQFLILLKYFVKRRTAIESFIRSYREYIRYDYRMRTSIDVTYAPVNPDMGEWWSSHVLYSKFTRQGIEVICAAFEQKETKPLANVILTTGWSETFLDYGEIIIMLFDKGFNVYTYDHQSQGLSSRWLSDSQLTWVHGFGDYVDDFVYYVTAISRDRPALPIYVLAHSMGGLIAAMAMSQLPTLVNRAVLIAPMFRNKCGMKALDFRFPLPQPIAYGVSYALSWAGLGTMNAIGFFKERPRDPLRLHVRTSDQNQLIHQQKLRERYPQTMSTCVTNDWVMHANRAQKKFSQRYSFVTTNTLIVGAENDRFVYNRAIDVFNSKCRSSKFFIMKGSLHDILHEQSLLRRKAMETVLRFFTQESDLVEGVTCDFPLIEQEKGRPLYSALESTIRVLGVCVATASFLNGLALFVSGKRLL